MHDQTELGRSWIKALKPGSIAIGKVLKHTPYFQKEINNFHSTGWCLSLRAAIAKLCDLNHASELNSGLVSRKSLRLLQKKGARSLPG